MNERGFRTGYLTYDELDRVLSAWSIAYPSVMRRESLGKTDEGRDVWLVTIGRDPDRLRPAAWVDANIHASEVSGSSVALSIIEALLRAHADPSADLADLPAHLREWLLADVLFYVMPRMCPDGVERVLARKHFVRSNHRDHRLGKTEPFWRHEDVDGDGRSLLMRVRDPAGDFVESTEIPNLMLPRRIDDPGPYYRLYPEGLIENFDGVTIPTPSIMSDTETDMNRNFPSGWQAEPHQLGAGPFPTSEPESRAVTEFAVKHPNIFVWLCLHTYGGVFIRPLGDAPDSKMAPHDLAVFRTVEALGQSIVGYPTVSGFTEFTYEPDKPLCGDLSNFAYVERGAVGFVCELWDFFAQVGFEVKRPFIKNYQERTSREDVLRMAAWDRDENQGRVVGTWRAVVHPQLGEVEVGGYDPLVGMWNPPPERLPELCERMTRFFLRLAAMAPRLEIASIEVTPLGGGLERVTVVVENRGYLPTYVLASSKTRPWNDPVRVKLTVGPGVELVSGLPIETVGHLGGWGGNDRHTAPALARTTLEEARRKVTWVVRGSGDLVIEAGCARTGSIKKHLAPAG
jgi:hypothetical protein